MSWFYSIKVSLISLFLWILVCLIWQTLYGPSLKFYLVSFFIAHVITGWIVYLKFNNFIKTLIAMSFFPLLGLIVFYFLSLFYQV